MRILSLQQESIKSTNANVPGHLQALGHGRVAEITRGMAMIKDDGGWTIRSAHPGQNLFHLAGPHHLASQPAVPDEKLERGGAFVLVGRMW